MRSKIKNGGKAPALSAYLCKLFRDQRLSTEQQLRTSKYGMPFLECTLLHDNRLS